MTRRRIITALLIFAVIAVVALVIVALLAAVPPMTPAEIRDAAQSVDYSALQRNTDDYIGAIVVLRGEASNVGDDGYLLNVGGLAQNVIVRPGNTPTPGAGDRLTVYARVRGRTAMLSAIGVEFHFPDVTALLVERN